METQNEQKANKIVDKFYGNFVPFHAHSKAFEECAKAKNAVLEAMQCKDEKHEQEKQQLIDKAAEWLRMTMDFFNNGEFNTEKFVNDFKQEMKGE